MMESRPDLAGINTRRARWGHVLTLFVAVAAFLFGVSRRDAGLNDTRTYSDIRFGLSLQYPTRWSIATATEGIIFRVRDLTVQGFPTTIQIAIQPAALASSARQVFDSLSLDRLQRFASYNLLSSPSSFVLADGSPAASIEYTYAFAESDPFLETSPIVVRGEDIVSLRQGQAVIISFLSDSNTFDENYGVFQNFLRTLSL